ncbi:hypothetical protein A1O1_06155 [Capronia coronata CBS 617.96]|uniref:SprT-like domain-containing protein n=1 Tax=Capronia coronata CBS 617.96 TaxID=1182541 RepID=W9XZ06_9EURO|nr:uncharacterized protein A1O1_06155 [Capronia coronata CBS 617.96]EXJ85787.1 hypothetical protein A1O1_06155 [Capronia coronata CBS 617.96]
MSDYSSEDDLPDLATILAPRPLMATSTNTALRRSPRKQAALESDISRSPEKRQRGVPSPQKQTKPSVRQNVQEHRSPSKPAMAMKSQSSTVIHNIPHLPHHSTFPSTSTSTMLTSNNRRSPVSGQHGLKVSQADSLLLPLKNMVLEDGSTRTGNGRPIPEADGLAMRKWNKSLLSVNEKSSGRTSKTRTVPRREQQPGRAYASRFVLTEARCNDDSGDSMGEEDENEDTDLSGFIVDDNAELSYHESSSPESDQDTVVSRRGLSHNTASHRRLQRGSPTRRRLDFDVAEGESDSESGRENRSAEKLSKALQHMCLNNDGKDEERKREIEVIDLTSSPVATPAVDLNTRPGHEPESEQDEKPSSPKRLPRNSTPFEDLDTFLKLNPPLSKPSLLLPPKVMPVQSTVETGGEEGKGQKRSGGVDEPGAEFKTPPTTPPRSPSKLKSPSKLLSPSKRQTVPQSPHRQSMDAFWDHNVVNEWNDTFSPKKAPATSPSKRLFAPFTIFSDLDSDSNSDPEEERESQGERDHKTYESFESLPSPCFSSSSPGKTRARSKSPSKTSPEKEEKKRLLEEKRAAAARKKEFDARKGQMAMDLLRELDTHVAGSRLAELSSSTGGVKIIWSKTLRSTAGRANWKRTVTKTSGSPVKGAEDENRAAAGPGVQIQHFASIELAEKIIDRDERLVNTLAHEFCHLANFMVSNVRDQPHGPSFKQWAARVTSHLRQSTGVPVWRQVQVTTKHSYTIDHKYLWVCAGRDRTPVMDFLNLSPGAVGVGAGCGAEYGRHSRSIDPDKHRCGKCKGKLVQVRPKPRATVAAGARTSPRKKSRIEFGVHKSSREGSVESSGSGSGSVFGSGARSMSGSGSGSGSRSASTSGSTFGSRSVSETGSRSSSGSSTGPVSGSMIETVELSD